MAASTQLASGLAGAIGCDYRQSRNQLDFVEFGGKVSRINLIPAAAVVSTGTKIIHGTWLFDLETGMEVSPGGGADIWWEQVDAVHRKMTPVGGAKLVNLGPVSYAAITAAELQALSYGTTPINGNNDATNKLVNGDVFAVLTNAGNYTKVQVVAYGYDITVRWTTYHLAPRYQVLGTGYNQPEDIKVCADELYAYVTERSGNLLRVKLTSANRAAATVVSSGMTAPHQISLDEDHNQAYVVEYANPGRLLRIDLASGAKTALLSNLENAIGLLVSADRAYAYVSEQTAGPDGGRVSCITLATGHRETLVTGMTAPFFMTWSDPGEGGILIAERDPANRISLINLNQTPPVVTTVALGVPFRPSSVAVMSADRLLVCCDSEVDQLDLTASVYVATGPMLLGIGHVPVSRISRHSPVNPAIDGYADTSVDPSYFFQVKDSPFGGSLPIMFNHENAFASGARFYKLLVDGVEPRQTWYDYKWSTPAASFVLRTIAPSATGYYPVRSMGELWYNHWLGYILNTSALSNGLHTIGVKLFAAQNAASEIGGIGDPGRTMVVQVDNRWPQASIDQIIHDGAVVGTCAIVNSGSTNFTFNITAQDPEQNLLSWSLTALWGDNKSKLVASDSYAAHVSPTKKWGGTAGIVPAPAWNAVVAGDPTSTKCAHTFYLGVWDRVINGWGYLHYADYHKSVTLMLP